VVNYASDFVASRKSADARRAEIVEAAIRVITRKGFSAATTRDVAAEAGVSHSLLHHYVSGREELMAAAFEHEASRHLADFKVELAQLSDVRARIEAVCGLPEPEHYMIWIDAWSEAPRSPALAETLRRHERGWEKVYADLVRDAVHEGVLVDTGEGPAARARRLLALQDGYAVQHFAIGSISGSAYRRNVLASWFT
jgi:AcrR family transcriptional regulator